MSISEDTLWLALQAVDDGEDPADVYARVVDEQMDPDTAAEIAKEYEAVQIEHDHDHPDCRTKYREVGICMGSECRYAGSIRFHVDCPCKCHEGGFPWN